jgi:hypothetical protein
VRKLRLADWASIAELISAIAVVISLLYVGLQVNENTNEIRAANRQQFTNRAHSATMQAATSPALAGAIAKVADGTTLNSVELTQYGYFIRGMLKDMEEGYLLHREGRLDEEYWKTRSALVQAYMTQTLARDIYRRDKILGVLHTDFVQWLDRTLEERSGS